MIEGWQNEEYLIIFDEGESSDLSQRYEIGKYLAGYRIVGLKGWDDFIVAGADGNLFTVPTVPLDPAYLVPYVGLIQHPQIREDRRLCGKVKWYTKPVIFGGDPTASNNMIWVNLEQHVQLVKRWNQLYQTVKPPQ